MKLIDIETGEEYCSNEIPEQFNKYCAPYIWCQKTGKVYEKREGYTDLREDGTPFHFTRDERPADKFFAIAFLEPLEKFEPVPEILAGDYVYDCYNESGNYMLANGGRCRDCDIKSIYRNGKLIWERKS